MEETQQQQQQQQELKGGGSNNNSRLSSLDYSRVNEGEEYLIVTAVVVLVKTTSFMLIPSPPFSIVASSLGSPGTNASVASSSSNGNINPTKVLYFTNRSVTPFMSTIAGKRIGEITLRDFKVCAPLTSSRNIS